MSDDARQQQEQHEVTQQIASAIDRALVAPITKDQAELLRWATGLTNTRMNHV